MSSKQWLCPTPTTLVFFFFQAEDGIRDYKVTGVQTCALPISPDPRGRARHHRSPDRENRRSVPRGDRRVGAQSGGRLPRDGGPTAPHQGAAAAAAACGGRRVGGPASGAGAPVARVSADPRAGRLAGAGGGAARRAVRAWVPPGATRGAAGPAGDRAE